MYGRYGYDQLSKTLLWVYVGLLLIYTVVSLFVDSTALYLLHTVLSFSLIGFIVFRTMSRNIAKRR